MEAHGQLTQDANFRNPKSKYKRSKNVFFVTCIALIVVRICTELLQLPALFVFLYHTLLLGETFCQGLECKEVPYAGKT